MEITHSEEKTWGVLTHALGLAGGFIPFGNILGPLLMWVLKKEESSFVDENGKSSLNFQLSFTIYYMILVMAFVPMLIGTGVAIEHFNYPEASLTLPFLLIGLILILAIIQFILVIVASLKSANGEVFRYPLSFRFLK